MCCVNGISIIERVQLFIDTIIIIKQSSLRYTSNERTASKMETIARSAKEQQPLLTSFNEYTIFLALN